MAGEGAEAALEAAKRKMSLKRCEICTTEEAKYRCPRCMKYSCSLVCVKQHKTTYNCNGVRDKIAFVSVNQFSDLNLLSDYRFLEDVGRMADRASRDGALHRPRTNKFVNFLRNRARRCNIQLKTLPLGFTQRRENTTVYSNKEKKFYWHLKLIFPHSHAIFTDKRVPDDKPLCDVLKHYIDPHESDPVIRQRLKIYALCPPSDIRILMKAEVRLHNGSKYEELDASKGLLDNLRGKVITEYPTLRIVLKKFKTDMAVPGYSKNKDTEKPSKDLVTESSSEESSSEEEGEIRDSS